MVPGVMGLQVKVGSTCVKSKVQVSLVEVVGSSVLVSRSRVRLRVLSPANALLGIAPIITVTVPLDELRDTWMLKLENGSVLELTAAKAPSLVCLKCCVWAVNTMGKTITATASSFFIFSPL